MRLDIFLPFLKKAKKGRAPQPASLLTRAARRVLPQTLFADPITGKPGLARRMLKKVGPTWLSAPVRRVVQSVCLATFLVLFFYVCWPYSAQPAKSWSGFLPGDLDGDQRRYSAFREDVPDEALRSGRLVYVSDESAGVSAESCFGRFRIDGRKDNELTLTPDEVPADKLDELLFSPGPWTLSEIAPGAWPAHYAQDMARKERLAAEFFLIIDPLVSISTAIAAKSWVWSLAWAAGILAVCVLVPRGFCGYLCPLGTLIDLFDWAIGKRVKFFRVRDDGWWVHIKYYVLLTVLITSVFGVLISGVFAAIPVVTRGLLFVLAPLQIGVFRGWHQVPPMNAGHYLSIALFFTVLGLGLLKPRFWCKYVCPSGAVFSLGNLFRVSERKVESSCINCNKCIEICPFDAIKLDYTTRETDCTLCQTCGGVCPTHAIKFVERWNVVELKVENDPPTGETSLGRRGFLATAAGVAAAVVGAAGTTAGIKAFGASLDDPEAWRPVRPPGSVPEKEFLELCIRCGECFKACPNNVLHPMGFQQGLEGLWTPHVQASWSGCESSCNNCGQVCPTGAIRAIPLEEKKVARMGLAIVNHQTCLPFAGREACQICVDECVNAGYNAIEFTRVGTEVDDKGEPIEGTGFLAPVVAADKCVGCGLCQTRCFAINAQSKKLLTDTAIVVVGGPGKEDRLMHGSYLALREQEQAERAKARESQTGGKAGNYLPDFLQDN